ncbi:MAG TPA: PLP-dependent aminotransferase family protein [Kofleriaceae bacterium]|nr:PLP-dependent aminotransferase family protein [Kofleriaceae bacterium]
MDVHISLPGTGQLTAGVYQQLREAILDGRLRGGDALPATRELARRLAVSRNTVIHAYQRLIADGFLEGRVGAGTFVTSAPALQRRSAPAGTALAPRAIWRGLPRELPARTAARHDFSIGAPDPALFPWDEWRRLVARQLRRRRRATGYPAPEGDPLLRAAIARHVGISRSVRAGADDVIVTSGAQQAFDLIARVLVEPGACVAVEDPGYPPARLAFHTLGARVVPVPVDGEGLDVAALPPAARLVYVTPSHQFPLGTPMSLARRMALLAWAERHGAAILEDDYDSEFRFDGRPLEPLQSLDRCGRVLYVGTFSKVLLPTLRLGFIVAPPSVMSGLAAAKLVADSHGALELQLALRELIDDGLFARHVRRLIRVYRERRERLAAALARHLCDAVVPLPSSAGLHTSVYLRDRRVDTTALAARALAAGVAIAPLGPYYHAAPRAGLALGYGLIAAQDIDAGIRGLAACLPQAPSTPARRAAPRRRPAR